MSDRSQVLVRCATSSSGHLHRKFWQQQLWARETYRRSPLGIRKLTALRSQFGRSCPNLLGSRYKPPGHCSTSLQGVNGTQTMVKSVRPREGSARAAPERATSARKSGLLDDIVSHRCSPRTRRIHLLAQRSCPCGPVTLTCRKRDRTPSAATAAAVEETAPAPVSKRPKALVASHTGNAGPNP